MPLPVTASSYTFAGVDRERELERLRRIERIFDAASQGLLEAAQIPRGACCLEVGAGAGSIAAWLAERVGVQGEVVAVDLDTSFLHARSSAARMRIVEADVRRAGLAASHFDAAHARYALVHNADWEALIDAVIACLKPGAAIVLEEPDFTVAKACAGQDSRAFDRVNAAICGMFRDAGKDPALSTPLPSTLEARAGCASSGPTTARPFVAGAILSRP
jgi:2-polyprenyl-3-methyl-5-hydroxy-6-metoxy-1,4-benzoquinol methylase